MQFRRGACSRSGLAAAKNFAILLALTLLGLPGCLACSHTFRTCLFLLGWMASGILFVCPGILFLLCETNGTPASAWKVFSACSSIFSRCAERNHRDMVRWSNPKSEYAAWFVTRRMLCLFPLISSFWILARILQRPDCKYEHAWGRRRSNARPTCEVFLYQTTWSMAFRSDLFR